MDEHTRRLDSWKEIASHFGRDVTTVRRWERREGLPVHRHVHSSRSSIYAYVSELDAWWSSRAQSREPGATAATSSQELAPAAFAPPPSWRGPVLRAAAVLLFSALTVSVPLRPVPPGAEIRALAVFPFSRFNATADEAYLNEGLTEAIIDDVSPLEGLRVIARASVDRYRAADVMNAGRELGIDAVLLGSAAIDGARLAWSVELIHAPTGRRLWQANYAGETRDLLLLEQTLLSDVRRVLGRDRHGGRSGQPRIVEAYWTYLRARRDWNRRTPEGLREAARLFERASRLDPAFALAFSGAADAQSLLGYYRFAPLPESLARAEAAARHALALNDALAEAHAALGHVHATRWEWADAGREYRRALELNPNYSTARHWYSNYLSIIGADDEAVSQARLAVLLDPLSPIVRSGALANSLRRAGRHDEALREYARTLDADPGFWNARVGAAMTFASKRMRREAVADAAIIAGVRPSWTAAAAAIYATFGLETEARRLLRELDAGQGVSDISYAHVYATLGDLERAVGCLQRAFDARDPDFAPSVREEWFRSLHEDPRVAAMVGSLNLPKPR